MHIAAPAGTRVLQRGAESEPQGERRMPTMIREKPEPTPAVHPLPEYRAEGETKRRYEDMKSVLQVPWMGVVTMAFAHYPTFFDTLWDGWRQVCASEPFVAAARELRALAEERVADLSPPPIADRLDGLGYAPRELDAIREAIEVFSHGNQPYVLIAFAARLLLEGGALSDDGTAPAPFEGRHAPDVSVPFVMVERHHAMADLQAVYDDVMGTLRLPFVNSDYRMLARWPSYFALAWDDLKAVVATAGHEDICAAYHDRALALVGALPNPDGLTAKALREAAAADASVDEVLGVTRLFVHLLPGLVTNVAFFRAQLN